MKILFHICVYCEFVESFNYLLHKHFRVEGRAYSFVHMIA